MRVLAVMLLGFFAVVHADEGSVADDLARTAEDMFKHIERADNVWPGYQPSLRPLGVFEPGRGVLVRYCADDVPDGWTRFADLAERPVSAECLLFRDDTTGLGSAPFHIEQSLGAFSATLMRRDAFKKATFFHEDFHGFQRAWPWIDQARTLTSLDESADSAALRASIEREGVLLRQAWNEPDMKEAFGLLQRWLALRLDRDSRSPSAFVTQTRRNEANEGTATWVGHAAAEQLTGQSGLMQHLGPILDQLSPAPRSLSNQVAFTYYGHGGLLVALLERWWEGDDWKVQIEDGTSLPELIKILLDVEQSALAVSLEDELGRRAWRRSERSHARTINRLERQRDREPDLLWVLEFYLPHAEGVESPVFSFRSDQVQRQPDGPLIIGQAENFELVLGDIHFRATGQTLMVQTLDDDDQYQEARVTRVSVLLPAPLTTDGLTSDGQFSEFEQFTDRSARIELLADRPVPVRQVEIDSGE